MRILSRNRLIYLRSFEDNSGLNARHVFKDATRTNIFVVMKTFSDRPVRTVKIWNASETSMETTVSFWTTKRPFVALSFEVDALMATALDLLDW